MADLFALSKIQDEILFRNDEYVSPEKAKAIKRIRSVGAHDAWQCRVIAAAVRMSWEADCSHTGPDSGPVLLLQRDVDGGAAWRGGPPV